MSIPCKNLDIPLVLGLYWILIWPDIWPPDIQPIILQDTGYLAWPDIRLKISITRSTLTERNIRAGETNKTQALFLKLY